MTPTDAEVQEQEPISLVIAEMRASAADRLQPQIMRAALIGWSERIDARVAALLQERQAREATIERLFRTIQQEVNERDRAEREVERLKQALRDAEVARRVLGDLTLNFDYRIERAFNLLTAALSPTPATPEERCKFRDGRCVVCGEPESGMCNRPPEEPAR